MKRLLGYFVRGLLVFVPAALTIFAVVWTFTKLDMLFRDLFGLDRPGLGLALGLAVTFGLITAIGIFASNFLGRTLFNLLDSILKRVPLIKLLYGSVKDFIEAFAGEKKSFDRPVVAELIPDGPKAVGFVTRDDLSFLGLDGQVAVYFPQSYNFAGSVLVLPADRVRQLEVDSSTAMAFIVSGGVAGPGQIAKKVQKLQ
ncbi:MAG: DUF502 domain-containing protein [Sedimentisphaerales bacterium]|nr:DUF502 domain-containing protein [Sedimentisphaerales bacterium]